MVTLLVTSSARGSGKTAVGAGLSKHLLDNGKKVGFCKISIPDGKNLPAGDVDSDAVFMKQLLALAEPADLLCPAFSDESDLRSRLKEVFNKVSQGKDVVIVEDSSGLSRLSCNIAELLNARVIIVEAYSKELLKAINTYQEFGKLLLGVVFNKVPKSRVEQVRSEIANQLGKAGINVLAVLPENRTLLALTVGELATHIQGELLSGAEKSPELVENFMLGAMTVDHGPQYFGRKANKAGIIRSERPDMQLAALQTSTRCLVLTGDMTPMPVVLFQAEEKNVPVISVKGDIRAIVTNIEDALGKTRFNHENKLPKLAEIMKEYFDFRAVYRGLGLTN